MKNKKWMIVVLILLPLIFAGACETDSGAQDDSRRQEEKVSGQILNDLLKAHPVPKFARSQLRQNLVEITTAQATTTQTTTFFFNMGIKEPVNTCPSIGFPIPATAQLTNPDQLWTGHNGRSEILAQVEPTGVYTGNTTGTYVMCIDAEGSPYAVYWEGFTQTLTGPAEWTGEGVDLVGPPSFEFTKEEE